MMALQGANKSQGYSKSPSSHGVLGGGNQGILGGPIKEHDIPSSPPLMNSPSSNMYLSNDSFQQSSPLNITPRHQRKPSRGILALSSNTCHIRPIQASQQSNYRQKQQQQQRQRVYPYQPTMTVILYGQRQKEDIKIIPLTQRRGTVILTNPLKRKKLTDARDTTLAKLRNENQKLQEKLEELQSVNRRLEMEQIRIFNVNQGINDKLNEAVNYKKSLNDLLSRKAVDENIFWHKNEPIFVIETKKTKANKNDIKAMNMNLEVIDYPKNEVTKSIVIEEKKTDKGDDDDMVDNSKLFENYLEKIVRSSKIFQKQYYKTLKKQKEAEVTVRDIKRKGTLAMDKTEAIQHELEKLQKTHDAMRLSKTTEIDALSVKMNNMKKDHLNEKEMIQQKHGKKIKKQEEKISEKELKLQAMNKERQDLITKWEESQSGIKELVTEKETLEMEYGKITKKLGEIQKHPILSTVKIVDEILDFRKIQREFYDDIFDEKANLHNMAFEILRKGIKNKTGFTTRYCKQMAFKILFEIIHICYNKINECFYDGIYNEIRMKLGILNENGDEMKRENESDLEIALDFLLKYQFEEIFGNICNKMIDGIISEIYEIEFDLITTHNAQNIFKYDLHEIEDPMKRDRHFISYINKICNICWKMVIFSHKNKNNKKNKLIFYPSYFLEENKDLKLDVDIYDKCTAHCEKKCDQILFYVFPIVIYEKDKNNIFAALAMVDNDDDDIKINDEDQDNMESESKIDDDEDDDDFQQKTKIKIKVVTRRKMAGSLSKDINIQSNDGKKEGMLRVGELLLLNESPSIPLITEGFRSIHRQIHKTLFESIQDILEPEDDDSDSDDDGDDNKDDIKDNEENKYDIDDADMVEMKIYKILFDILVTCYVEIVDIINNISNDNLTKKKLKFDKRYHLLLNLKHYYNKFSKTNINDNDDNKEEKEIVMGLINKIYNKYCQIYKFLESENELIVKTKTYIMKCCESCFHFGAYSIQTVDDLDVMDEIKEDDEKQPDEQQDDKNEYGLYPLSFVRDGENCSVITALKEKNMNNDIIDFKKVMMGKDDGLCIYNDLMHEKEGTSDIDDVRNAKICYFTWPAIVHTNKNNQYIYGNIPKKYLTKIWVLLNNEVYHMIYAPTNQGN